MRPLSVPVFISSTYRDLKPERRKVEKAVREMAAISYIGMEQFGSRDEDTRRASLDEVSRSELYIGIFAGRYGSGITEAEYRCARQRRPPLSCLIYFKANAQITLRDRTADQEAKLAALKAELRDNHTIRRPFSSPEDLARQVTADVHNWLFHTYLPDVLDTAAVSGDEARVRRTAAGVRDEAAFRDGLEAHGIRIDEDAVGSVLASGHRRFMDRLLAGITGLPIDYAGRVENFLIEYLGAPDSPTPFFGRQADLATLNAWLADRSAAPYSLITEPAGRGKSAVLAHWTRSLLSRDDVGVFFFPISIRFRTNPVNVFFEAAIARLAALHGENTPKLISQSTEHYRELFRHYLERPLPNGRLLLVVLDGLDEAAGWKAGPDLWPLLPPNHLRILVSSRLQANEPVKAWVDSLGWGRRGLSKRLPLARLNDDAILELMEALKIAPEDRDRRQLLKKLVELTSGDPLVVRLYADQFLDGGPGRRARDLIAELRDVPAGLEGFFDSWWNQQSALWGEQSPLEKPRVQAMLNMLSTAFGPLGRDDVFRLMPAEHAFPSMDALALTLTPLRRFVIGDGSRQDGYVFTHSRLNGYFNDRLSVDDRLAWERQFQTHGRRLLDGLNEGTLEAVHASPYFVEYYGAHLKRARAGVDAVMALVSNGWRLAWEHQDKSQAGFLRDVDSAWQAADEGNRQVGLGEGAPYLGEAICCALVHASVNSLAANIPPELLRAFLEQEVWAESQALAHARHIPDAAIRGRALAAVAPLISVRLLPEVVSIAIAIPDEAARSNALTGVAPSLASADHLMSDVLSAVEAMVDVPIRARSIRGLASSLRSQGLLKAALAVVDTIRPDGLKAEVLSSLVPYLKAPLKTTVVREALKCILKTDGGALPALESLVPHLPASLMPSALSHAIGLRIERSQAEALQALAPFLGAQLMPQALEAASSIAHWWDQSDEKEQGIALAALAPHLPDDLVPGALKATRALRYAGARAASLLRLARRCNDDEKADVFSEAMSGLGAITDEYSLSDALSSIASDLPESLAEEAFALARNIRSDAYRAKALTALAPILSDELLEEAFRAAVDGSGEGYTAAVLARMGADGGEARLQILLPKVLSLKSEAFKAKSLIAIATRLTDGFADAALAAARGMRIPADRAGVLAVLVPQLSSTTRPDVAGEAWSAACASASEALKSSVLARVAEYLPVTARKSAIQDARAIVAARHRSAALESLAHSAGEPLRGVLLREAAAAARAISNQHARCLALIAVARSLRGAGKTRLMHQAFESALDVAHPVVRAAAFVQIAFQADPEMLRRLLEDEPRLGHNELAVRVLAAAIPRLPKALLAIAVRRTRKMSQSFQPALLMKLASRFSGKKREDLQREAFTCAAELADGKTVWPLTLIAPDLPSPLKTEALATALTCSRTIRAPRQRIEALLDLRPHLELTAGADVARELLTDVRGILAPGIGRMNMGDAPFASSVLRELAADLPREMLPEAVTAAKNMEAVEFRAEALLSLALRLAEPERTDVVRDALAALYRSGGVDAHDGERAISLADRVPVELVREVLSVTAAIDLEQGRAESIAGLAPRLPAHLLPAALELAGDIRREEHQSKAFAGLAPRLRGVLLARAVDIVRSIGDSRRQAAAWAALSSRLPESALKDAVKNAEALDSRTRRSDAFAALAPYLPKPLLEDTYQLARRISDRTPREDLVIAAANRLPPSSREAIAARLLAIASSGSASPAELSQRMAPVIPLISTSLFPKVLQLIRELEPRARVYPLRGVVSRVSGSHAAEARELLWTLPEDEERARLDAQIAGRVPDDLRQGALDEALSLARRVKDAEAVGLVATHLPEPRRTDLFREAVSMVREARSPDRRLDTFARLALSAPESCRQEMVTDVLDAASQTVDGYSLAAAMSAIAPHLGPRMTEALDAIRAIARLAPSSEATKSNRDIECSRAQRDAITPLIRHMPEQSMEDALALALAVPDGSYQVLILADLVPRLPEKLLDSALDAVRDLHEEPFQSVALAAVASRLDQPKRGVLLREAFDTALSSRNAMFRDHLIIKMAPHFPPALLDEAFLAARTLPEDRRAKTMSALLERWPSPDAPKTREIVTAVTTTTGDSASEALASLVKVMSRFGPTDRLALWNELLRGRANHSRQELTSNLAILIDPMIELGGLASAEKTCRALMDVGEWWP